MELLKHLWPITEPSRLIGIRFMHLRSRLNAVRMPENRSDIIDLSEGSEGLPWPVQVVAPRLSNHSGEEVRSTSRLSCPSQEKECDADAKDPMAK